jgi:hypothetical protein
MMGASISCPSFNPKNLSSKQIMKADLIYILIWNMLILAFQKDLKESLAGQAPTQKEVTSSVGACPASDSLSLFRGRRAC